MLDGRRALYNKERLFDEVFEKVLLRVKEDMKEKKDDFLLMCVGTTGSGKSSLMFHAYEVLDLEGCSVDYVGLDPKDFATSLYKVRKKKGFKFAANDEANISKRNALTKFNKDIIDLYFSIRGLEIFHWWNNPSIDYVDKVFIEERIKGLIYIYTKDKDRPRKYYYFRKVDLIRLYEKYGDLKLKTLDKYGNEYKYYEGWFKPYKGKLWEPYLEKKRSRMEDKIDSFFETYGKEATEVSKEFISKAKCKRIFKINDKVFEKALAELKLSGMLQENIHYMTNLNGRSFYNPTELEQIMRDHLGK